MSFDKYRRKRHFSFECRTKRSYLEMYSANYAISLITLLVLIVVVAAKNGEPLTCYSCSSDSLEKCATLNFGNSSRELPVEICSIEITSCFTKVSNGITVRGCKTPTMECASVVVGESGDQCSACESEKCNGNIFPEYRLHCLQCAGEKCVRPSNSVAVRYPCANYVESDSCYGVFSPDGTLAYRGCTSDNDTSAGKRFCNQNAAQCDKCASRGCNNAEVQWEKPLSCIVCDSTQDEDCKTSNGVVSAGCMPTTLGYKDHCFTRVANHSVARGCLRGAQPDIADDCSAWYSQTCKICAHNDCNQASIDDKYCFECASADDTNCTSKVEPYMRKQCQLNLVESDCYRISESEEGESIRRGCASELNETDVVTCHIANQRYCKLCSGNDCNRKAEPQSCYRCNSAIDANCVSNVTGFMTAECDKYVDQCIILIDSLNNDAIVRDCLRNVFKDDTFCRNNPSLCNACEEDNCNSLPLVDNQTCYTCDSTEDPNCHGNLTDSLVTNCTLSANNLGCYHFFNETESTVRRGCLSDLSPVEYTKCESNQAACKICHAPNCNNRNAFQQCYQCNSTENVDCIRATHWFEPVTCQAYNDQCYVHVANDVVTRGCLNESINVNLTAECEDPDTCEKCAGDVGCNGKIVDGEFCLTCDSAIDPNCRTNVTIGLRTQCPLAVTTLGCYRFEDDGDVVIRGCLSDIRPDERQICRRQGDNCKTCFGDDCNARTSFRTCHVCNSTASVKCIRAPSQFPVVTCRDYLDECFTRVKNDVVDRGCLRQAAATNEELIKDCADSDVCATCVNDERCNRKVVDGEFCLTCDSNVDPSCRTNVTSAMRTQCPLSVNQMGCYRFEDEGDVVKRGCLSDIRTDERQMCRRQGNDCKTCIGNDCNAKIAFQQCHVCNSTDSVNCIRAPSIFPVTICSNYLDDCFTHVRNDTVARGCVLQSDSEVIAQDCQNKVNTDYCDRCRDGKCNDHTVEGEFCVTCDSNIDPNCRTNLTLAMRTQCTLAVRPMGCYRFEDDGDLVKRGCVSDVRRDERDMCRRQGDECKTCLGDDCNRKIHFQRCVRCRSIGNDTTCETNAASFSHILCKHYVDDCFTHVRNVTTRGCLLEQQNDLNGVDFQKDCSDPDLCRKCDQRDGCNEAPVALETCGVQHGPEEPLIPVQCAKAVTQLGCYRAVDQFTNTSRRGCVSELPSPERQLCREEGATCKTCKSNSTNDVQMCNGVDSFTRCYGCDTSSNPNCATTPNDGMIVTCENYNDQCFASFNATDGQVRRGCLTDMSVQFITTCKANERNCKVCVVGIGACNNQSAGIERCIECDSRVDRNCINQLYLFGEGKVCNANEPLRWQGCYLSKKNGHARRGCVSDIDDDALKEHCVRGTGNCKVCSGRNCNRKETFSRCYDCDSQTFEQCSQVNASATVVCDNYLDTCVVSLRQDGHIRRGCGEQFTPSELKAAAQFRKCPGGGCNGQVYPAARPMCHRCDGDILCQYLEGKAVEDTALPCPRYSKTDSCFSLLRMDGQMYRGCMSDANEVQNECQLHPERCKVCIGNACNTNNRTRTPKLECFNCDRTADCAGRQYPDKFSAKCQAPVLFQHNETCFIERTTTGVRRGCTLDAENTDRWCRDNPHCSMCDEPNCNLESSAFVATISTILLLLSTIFTLTQ